MQLTETETWIVALCFGAFMVGLYSWSRFDEPSYDSQSEYFARYKPRFSTSYIRYARAKWGYVCTIVCVYIVFSLVPELFKAVGPMNAGAAKPIEGPFPLAVALALITLQNAPGLRDLERRIRGFLHSVARIPESIRRTVAQMRGSPFNFEPNMLAAQTRKLGRQISSGFQQPETLSNLIFDDDLLHTWYSTGSVLSALSESNRGRTGIDPLFFDYYKDELDNIITKHAALAETVRDYFTKYFPASSSDGVSLPDDTADSSALREIRDLRDRLYTFVACGVHSSVESDAESLEIIRRLGFAVTPADLGPKTKIVGPLAGLSIIALVILSIFTGYSTELFRGHVLSRLAPQWLDAFPVPTGPLALYLWSWSTAAFYLAAILGALAFRNSRVGKREWFDITNLNRERPILRYITPTLLGTALGSIALTIIAIVGGPAFKSSLSDFDKAVGEPLRQSLPWFPLATVMSFIAVALSDSQTQDKGFWWSALRRSLGGALGMGIVGFLTSRLSISTGIVQFGSAHDLRVLPEVLRTGMYVSVFIAAQIGLFALVLCLIIQIAERYTLRARSFAGKYIDAVTRQGPMFCIFLGGEGVASLLEPDGQGQPLCFGQWQHFPEGTAVKWDAEAEGNRCKAGDFGLISSYGDSLIYEGYRDGYGAAPEFVAPAHLRPHIVNNRRRCSSGNPSGDAADRAADGPIGPAPAEAA